MEVRSLLVVMEIETDLPSIDVKRLIADWHIKQVTIKQVQVAVVDRTKPKKKGKS